MELDWNKGHKSKDDVDIVLRNDYISNMQSEMNEICESLLMETEKFKANDFIKKVKSYADKNERLLYTNMSNFIFSLDDQEFGIIQSNMDKVIEHIYNYNDSKDDSIGENCDITKRIILKIWDHINLARRQYILFSQKDDDYQRIVEKKMEIAEAKITKEMTIQLISIVSIFTALSFLIFGGMSSLDNIFEGAKDIQITKLIIVGTIWCFCIMNLVFVFLFFVGKLTKMDISSASDVNASIIKKYPLIWLSNWVIISILTLSCWAYYIQHENFSLNLYNFLKQHSTMYFLLGTGLIIFLIVVAARILYKLYNNKDLHNHE